MSADLPKNNTDKKQSKVNNLKASEEIDLLVLFNIIGNAFSAVCNFFRAIFRAIFSSIIYSLRVLLENWKLITVLVVCSSFLGFFVEKSQPTVYSSGMLVKPYYDSKYQLVTNINYFNELISNEDYASLGEVFEMEESLVKTLVGFKIDPGPENDNDRILQYNNFLKKIDSSRAQEISYEDYIENRNIYSGNVFLITAESHKKDIFRNLEKGIASAFTNEFSKSERQKRDSLIAIQKQNLLDQISVIDSLKGIYIGVLQEESKITSQQIKFGDIPMTSQSNKSNTKEYELLNKEISLRNELGKLDEQQIEENTYFDVVSSFQQVGGRVNMLSKRYSIIFPIASFLLLCFFFISRKTILFIRRYEL